MNNIFRQDKFEIDLIYMQNYFLTNRSFNCGKSFEKNTVLYAKSDKGISKLMHILEREKYIRECINNVFKKGNNKNIRIYYKLCYDYVYCDGKEDKRNYEYFRIIYQTTKEDLIYDEKKIECNDDVFKLISESYNKVNSIIEVISNVYAMKKEISGNYNLVFPTFISGLFIHEMIGHFLEDDFFYHPLTIVNENTKSSNILNVYDLSELNESPYIYDDSGNYCHDIQLIRSGKIIDCMSNNSGNKRRQDYSFRCLTRMRTTYVSPISEKKAIDFVKEVSNGIYIEKIYGGNVNPIDGNYVLSGYGVLIVNGEKTNFISKLKIEGNILNDLIKIEDIGNDLEYQGIECIKKNQVVRVGVFSPSMLVKNIKISGVVYE